MKKNIVLIGMPGVGKSTAGVILAKVLGYQFVDVDLLIQRRENRLLSRIIEEEGVEGFIEIESRVNASLFVEDSVISTGGSVIYGDKAMKHLSEIGVIVYLKLPFEILEKRLKDIEGRGVLLKEGQTLAGLYEERLPLYEKYAHIIIDETGLGIEQTVRRIVEEYKRFSGVEISNGRQ